MTATKPKLPPKPRTINGQLDAIVSEWRETAEGYRRSPISLEVRDPIASADRLDHWANQLEYWIGDKTNQERDIIEYDHKMNPIKRGRK